MKIMVDHGEIVKILQGFINRDNLFSEQLRKFVKTNNKSLKKLRMLKQEVLHQKEKLEESLETQEELIRVIENKKQIKIAKESKLAELQDELNCFSNQYELCLQSVSLNPTKHEDVCRKRLYLKLLKFITKIFIDSNTPSNIIRGFAANDFDKTLHPFEFNTEYLKENELITEMWELIKKTSNNIDEWDKLFQI